MVAGLLGRKADAFAALLDGTSTGAPDPSLARMGDLVQRLSAVPQPSAAFRSSLREQLVTAATHSTLAPGAGHGLSGGSSPAPGAQHGTSAFQSTPVPAPAAGGSGAAGGASSLGGASSAGGGLGSIVATFAKSAPLWAKLLVAGTAVAVSGTGVGVSAHRALPGDFFYGIKKQAEAVQLDLASGAQEKALTQLGFAHARADEIQQLIKRDHVVPGVPLSADTAKELRSALQNWAENAGEATTSLVAQIRALGTSAQNARLSAKLRQTLSDFTSGQFTQIGTTLADLPVGPVQSLTVSALGYLQRVDRVLGGNPDQLTQSLVKQLPVPLSSLPGVADLDTVLHLPVGVTPVPVPSSTAGGRTPAPGSSGPGSTPQVPTAGASGGAIASPPVVVPLPTLPPLTTQLPTGVLPTGVLPTGALRSLGGAVSAGAAGAGGAAGQAVKGVGSAVAGTGKTVTSTVKGVVGTVTGGLTSSTGPALPLPTAVPTIPLLPSLPGLGGLGN